jgi:hypothetical protein
MCLELLSGLPIVKSNIHVRIGGEIVRIIVKYYDFDKNYTKVFEIVKP